MSNTVVMSTALSVDTKRLIHDTIDGETIIIDSIAGRLTMLGGAAATIWLAAVAGIDPELLAVVVGDRFGDHAAQQTRETIDQLRTMELISVVDTAGADAGSLEWPEHWQPPTIEQFDDIADIMTMDPIHEVDPGQGWPRKPPAAP
jgi:hypothetical protein